MHSITQLENDRITHSQDVHRGNRQYISAENIKLLAQIKFEQSVEGLTYLDLVNEGPFKRTESLQHAKETLYYHYDRKHLFTYRRTNPQQYFATKDDAVMAPILREKNTHSHPTGVRSSSSPNGHSSSSRDGPPLANALEHNEAHNFLHALILLKVAPLEMHNLRLDIRLIDPNRYYDIIPLTYREEKKNKAKVHEERTGNVHVTFRAYPKGTVVISIACSKSPFRIETDWDVTKLFSFVGEVRNKLQQWLRDVNASIVPPIEQWRLIHADINKDVKVPPHFQLTFPKMQLPIADGVLRMYVKNLGYQTVLRLEQMRKFNEAFGDAVNSLTKGASFSSSSTTAIFPHSLNPAAFVEKAEQERKIAMLMSRVADLEEMILESRKLPAQEIRLNKETTLSEQIVVYNKKKEKVGSTGKSVSSSDDGYKQTPFNNHLIINTTNSAKVENNNTMEMLETQHQYQYQQQEQEQQPPIAIPQSTTSDDVPFKISSAADLLEERKTGNNQLRISTGSKRLDDLLSGGIERGAVTEIVGPSGTGKTELCFTLSVNAHQLKHQQERIGDDALDTAASGGGVLFIDTGQSFDRSRVFSIAQARGLDPDVAVKSIAVERIHDFQALGELIGGKLEEFLKKNPDVVLVIVDSITALQPEQRMKKEEEYLSSWQQRLDSLMYSLKRVALENDIAVVVINRTNESASSCHFGQMEVLTTTARKMILNAITYRLLFNNQGGNKVARIVHSSYHPEEEVLFTMEHEGITDIHQ